MIKDRAYFERVAERAAAGVVACDPDGPMPAWVKSKPACRWCWVRNPVWRRQAAAAESASMRRILAGLARRAEGHAMRAMWQAEMRRIGL